MIPVVYLPPNSQHDQYQFELLFNHKMWLPNGSYEFAEFTSIADVSPSSQTLVLVIPSKYYEDKISEINTQIARFSSVLLVISGNEEGCFDLSRIEHPNKKIYYTTPHLSKTRMDLVDRFFGDGYPPPSSIMGGLSQQAQDKNLDVYFAGQITHKRREQAVVAMRSFEEANPEARVKIVETAGFRQGETPEEYYSNLASAKVAPCPSGPETNDTFRVYEALEAMAVPIVDTK